MQVVLPGEHTRLYIRAYWTQNRKDLLSVQKRWPLQVNIETQLHAALSLPWPVVSWRASSQFWQRAEHQALCGQKYHAHTSYVSCLSASDSSVPWIASATEFQCKNQLKKKNYNRVPSNLQKAIIKHCQYNIHPPIPTKANTNLQGCVKLTNKFVLG